jgi:hypothetical protein
LIDTGQFAAGQCWRFRTPPGYETARLVIGAIVRFPGADDVACVSITAAPQRRRDGTTGPAPIVLLPMTLQALAATVTQADGTGSPVEGFAEAFERWHEDERGFGCFTVPFDGHLDLMIARQMAATGS